jgi:hypothetical protein
MCIQIVQESTLVTNEARINAATGLKKQNGL